MRFEDVVIGSSLSAVLFAYYTKSTLILNSNERPFRFDTLDTPVDFLDLRTENHRTLWSWVVYEHSLNGHVPFGPCVSSVRIGETEISITAREGLNFKANFSRCFVFDDTNVFSDNELIGDRGSLFRVFDWMNVRSCMPHRIKKITTGEDFVKEVYFYKSERIDGDHNKKDLVSVSYLTMEQLREFDYSDTMAKFKVISHMQARGATGILKGTSPSGEKKKARINVEPSHREVINIGKRKYKDTEKVRFLDLTPEEVLNEYS